MGEARDVNGVKPSERRDQLAHEISILRDDLGGIIEEVERRGREALDVRSQVRRHPTAAITVIAGAALLVTAVVVRSARRRRVQRELAEYRRFRRTVAQLVAWPDRLQAPQPRHPVAKRGLARAGRTTARRTGRHALMYALGRIS